MIVSSALPQAKSLYWFQLRKVRWSLKSYLKRAREGAKGVQILFDVVHPDIAYAKLASLAEGARIATQRLW